MQITLSRSGETHKRRRLRKYKDERCLSRGESTKKRLLPQEPIFGRLPSHTGAEVQSAKASYSGRNGALYSSFDMDLSDVTSMEGGTRVLE